MSENKETEELIIVRRETSVLVTGALFLLALATLWNLDEFWRLRVLEEVLEEVNVGFVAEKYEREKARRNAAEEYKKLGEETAKEISELEDGMSAAENRAKSLCGYWRTAALMFHKTEIRGTKRQEIEANGETIFTERKPTPYDCSFEYNRSACEDIKSGRWEEKWAELCAESPETGVPSDSEAES